ncbi:MAG: tRNA-dihydrouridine synthase C, partial [Halioglobus sp.]
MRLILAPMEGVIDHTMRRLLTQLGGVDRCVTEFVRVSERLLPPKVFYRLCPELHTSGKTASGAPVYVQLLGGQPIPMAENAARAAQLGALGVDLNFGCPAKTVNKSDGGAILLREPERVHKIVQA